MLRLTEQSFNQSSLQDHDSEIHLVASQASADLRFDPSETTPFWRLVIVVIVEVVVVPDILSSLRLAQSRAL